MSEVGLRELKTHASEIVRKVKEERSRYIITHHGHPVALIVPIEEASIPPEASESGALVWDELLKLGEAIGNGWQSPKTSTELLSEMRR